MLSCLLALAPLVQDVTTVAPTPSHSAVHPADATVYFEVPDVRGMTDAYADSPIARMLRDPEWNTFAAKAMGEDPETFALDAWCVERFSAMLDEVTEVADGDVDLRTAFAGLHSASVSLSVPTGDGDVSALCVFDYGDAANADAGARFLAGTFQLLPHEVQTKQAPLTLFGQEGLVQRYRSTTSTDDPGAWSATCGTSVVFAVGVTPDAWRALSDERARQMAGVAPPDDDVPLAGGLTGGTTTTSTPLYRAHLRTDDASALLARLQETSWASSVAGTLAVLDAYLPDGPVDRWCTTQLGGGSFTGASLSQGAACIPGVGGAPIPALAPRLLPHDAFAAWATHVEAEQLAGVVVDSVAGLIGSDADGARRFLAEDAQVDLVADLLAPLGTAGAAYVMPLAGPSVPDHAVVLQLEDRERFVEAMQKVFDALEARMGTQLAFRDGKYRGSDTFSIAQHESIRSMGIPSLGAADMLVDSIHLGLSVAVLDDRVVVSTDRRSVTREVKRLAKLEDGAPLHPLAAEGAYDDGKTVMASVVDWGGMVGDVYDMARGLLELSGLALGVGIDVASMPDREAVTRHLGATRSHAFLGEDGARRVGFSEGSFGPEVVAAAVALGVGFVAPRAPATRPVTAPAEPVRPVEDDADADANDDQRVR